MDTSPSYADTFDPAVIGTIIAEAGADPDGQRAVASVIRNRVDSSGMSAGDVVRQPNQFAGLTSRNAVMDSSSPVFQQTAALVGPILNGVDAPTTDATHFYSGSAPPWAIGRQAQNIGGNKFLSIGYTPPADAQPAPQGNGSSQLDESILNDAPAQGASAQPAQGSQLDESIFGDPAPAQPKAGDGSVVDSDSQNPLNVAQTAAVNRMRATFDPAAPAGSANRPYHAETADMVARVPTGSWYVDADGGLVQKPGAKSDEVLGAETGGLHVLNNAALGLDTALRAGGALVGAPNWTDDLSHMLGQPGTREAIENQAAALQAKAAQGVVPGKIGQFLGEAGATGLGVGALGGLGLLPTAGVAGAVAGGVAGGVLDTNSRDLPGIIKDGLAGGVTGGVLHGALGRLGALGAPQVQPNAQYLLDRGVQLTPGGILGGTVKSLEDKGTSLPHYFLGDSIQSAKRASLESYNRGAVNEVLAPIGQRLPQSVDVGHDAIGYAKQAVGDAYDSVLPNMNLRLTNGLVGDIQNVKNGPTFNLLPDSQRAQFDTLLRDNLLTKLTGPRMTGENFKLMDSGLGKAAADFQASANPNDRLLGQAVNQARTAIRNHLAAQNPVLAPELAKADASYAMYTRLRDAAAKVGAASNEGVVSPAQLLSAVRSGDRSLSHDAFARGDALLQDYATAGLKTVPSNVPDSGTAGRMKLTLGEILGHVPALPLALLSRMYATTGGRKTLQSLVADKSPADAVGRFLKVQPGFTPGLFGTLAPVTLNQQPQAAPPLSLYPLAPGVTPRLPSP